MIAGDVFDRASPPNSAVRQFNRFLKRVAEETEAAVVMISGNHDSVTGSRRCGFFFCVTGACARDRRYGRGPSGVA